MTTFDGAPCIGRAWTFESTEMAHHIEARWLRPVGEIDGFHPAICATDNGVQETTNASRPRTNGAGTPIRGLRQSSGDD